MTDPLTDDIVLARRLRVSRAWLRAETEAGRLPHVQAGERYLYDERLVRHILLARARGEDPAADPPAPARADDDGGEP
jgi:hypothetical protein